MLPLEDNRCVRFINIGMMYDIHANGDVLAVGILGPANLTRFAHNGI